MTITNNEKNLIIDSCLRTFADYQIIDYDYILNFIKAFEDEELSYDGFMLDIQSCPKDSNPYLYISFKIQTAIYTKLCAMAVDDADILLSLVTNKMRVVNMVARRLNFTDEQKKEDYLIDALTAFDGEESIDTFITRYVIAKMKGIPYVSRKEQAERALASKTDVSTLSKKDKKKKKKNNELTNMPIPEVIKEEEVPKEESPYDLCLKNCGCVTGSKESDLFVTTFLSLGTYDLIDYSGNKEYAMYMLLRFGFIKEMFYSLGEIAQICKINIKTILEFEKYTVNVMRKHINAKVDYYLKLLINE